MTKIIEFMESANSRNGRCVKCDLCDNLTITSIGQTDICFSCLKELSKEFNECEEYIKQKVAYLREN